MNCGSLGPPGSAFQISARSVMSGAQIKIDFLEEKEEFGLERQNTLTVSRLALCGLRWLGWFDHCP